MKQLMLRSSLIVGGIVIGLGLIEIGLHLFPGLLPPPSDRHWQFIRTATKPKTSTDPSGPTTS